MEAVFLKNFNMSFTTCWLILAVIVLRLLLNKAPKRIRVIMWALVAVRLICPFSFKSIFSLIPSNEIITLDSVHSPTPTINSGINSINNIANPVIAESFGSDITQTVFPLQIINMIASNIWIVGIIVMLLYMLTSYFSIYKKIKESILLEDNIYLCDRISTPFILGLIKPKIYIPSSISEADLEYVKAHEYAHIKRHDHWWKPLGFIILTVHWFNPLVWVAYILLCRDIELACDEKVINEMGAEIKKPYSQALINCSVSNRKITACPLAFGEVSVKKRVKTVLNYKQPAFWLSLTAVVACGVIAVCFLTNPIGIKINEIKDFGGFKNIFNDVDAIKIVKYGNSIKVEDVDFTLENLKKIRLEPNPISLGLANGRDKTYQLALDNNYTLCFNNELNEMCIDTSPKASYSYIVKNPKVVQEIFINGKYYTNSVNYAVYWNNDPSRSIATGDISFKLAIEDDYLNNSTTTTYIKTKCSNGDLWDISSVKENKPISNELISDSANDIHWSPYNLDPETGTEIEFTVYNGATDIYSGKLLITFISKEPIDDDVSSSIVTYNIQLTDCDGLYLQQGTDESDGLVFLTDGITYNKYKEHDISEIHY